MLFAQDIKNYFLKFIFNLQYKTPVCVRTCECIICIKYIKILLQIMEHYHTLLPLPILSGDGGD